MGDLHYADLVLLLRGVMPTYDSIPPHEFTYHGNLPDPFSGSQDHWGYSNGGLVTNLIPSFTVGEYNYVGPNRNTSAVYSNRGALREIKYPTGGKTVITYESNQADLMETTFDYECLGVSNCSNFFNCISGSSTFDCNCSTGGNSTKTTYIKMDDKLNNGGRLRFVSDSICGGANQRIPIANNNPPPNEWQGIIEIKLIDSTTSDVVFTIYEIQENPTLYGSREIPPLDPTHDYYIMITGDRVQIDVELDRIVYTNNIAMEDVGGLRIREITDYDTDGSKVLKKRRYTYHGGKLMTQPSYLSKSKYTKYLIPSLGQMECGTSECVTYTMSATSATPLGTTQGSIIGYDSVDEEVVDGSSTTGKTTTHYYNETYADYDVSYAMDRIKNGKVTHQQHYHEDGRLLREEYTKYSYDIEDHDRESSFIMYSIVPTEEQSNKVHLYHLTNGNYVWTHDPTTITQAKQDSGVYTTRYEHARYERITNYTLYTASTTTKDYFYDANDNFVDTVVQTHTYAYADTSHLQMTSRAHTNSDGITHEYHMKYMTDYPDATVRSWLTDAHRLTPAYEIAHLVSGDTLDGRRTIYLNSQHFPREGQRYERTWHDSGTLLDGEWVNQVTINQYHPTNGRVSIATKRGWIPEQMTYNNIGQRTGWTKGNYTQSWSYDNHQQLDTLTTIDGTQTTYTYDDLQRLHTTTDDVGVQTSIDYHYGIGTSLNHTKVTQLFPDFGTLTNQTLINATFVDGLGREVQQLQFLQSATDPAKSIAHDIMYDNYGRKNKIEEPYKSNSAPNNFTNFFLDGSNTLTVFEPSPLNRPTRVSNPADDLNTFYAYGTNTDLDSVIMDHTAPVSYYPAGTLYKHSTRDREDQTTETYTDLRGRTVLSRIKGNPTTTDRSIISDTYTLYDHKDRPTYQLPPGYGLSTPTGIYHRVYSGDDLVLTDDRPDCAAEYIRYDDRDLPTHRQDGEMRADSLWYTIEHDQYGHKRREGWTDSETGAIQEQLMVMTYDSTGITTGKMTRSMQKVLDSDRTIIRTYEYDQHGRQIVTRSNSILHTQEGSKVDSLVLDSRGVAIETHQRVVPDSLHIRTKHTYDHAGREKKTLIEVTTTEDKWQEQEVCDKSYTDKEQVSQLVLGDGLQVVDYAYREDRRLLTINGSALSGNDLFQMELRYGVGDGARTDGNIGSILWTTPSTHSRYVFDYNFQKMLTTATYTDFENSANNGAYDVQIIYADHRGNPKSIKRWGVDPATMLKSNTLMDDMVFDYISGTNQIEKVTEPSNTFTKTKGYKSNDNENYTYNANGAMTHDPSRGADIINNHLNLQQRVEIPDSNGMIVYYYDATGELHRQEEIRDSVVVSARDYIGAVEYIDGAIDQIKHANGYITLDRGLDDEHLRLTGVESGDKTYESLSTISSRDISSPDSIDYHAQNGIVLTQGFDVDLGAIFTARIDTFPVQQLRHLYFIADHLGTPRVFFEDSSGVAVLRSEVHVYPFGAEMTGQWQKETRYNHIYQDKNDNAASIYSIIVILLVLKTPIYSVGLWRSIRCQQICLLGLHTL